VIASSPRQGGQAVDVRGAALKVVERMGLIQDIRTCRTSFRGMSVCNEQGEETERTTERTLSGGPPRLHVFTRTALSNIRITTFFAGESEVKIVDPSRIR